MTDWDRIVKEHGELVYRLAKRILGSEADAEEVFQEVFLEVFQHQQKEAIGHWNGFLRRLATHRALDRLRRVRRNEPLSGEELSAVDSPHELAVASELADHLRQAIVQLPEQQAEVFALSNFGGCSHKEIAKILGIETNSVKVVLHKARTKLHSLLKIETKGAK